jgi:alpha-L-rhamnosidase
VSPVHTPHFSYSGFRYALLMGWPGGAPPPPSALTCSFVHTAVQQAGAVHFNGSTGPVYNAIQAALLQTQLSNLMSVPTDCPQR